jgi:outer membrane receptor protein involved in Fe transport
LSLGAQFFPFTGQVTVFYKNAKDYIYYEKTGSPPRFKYTNIGEQTSQGVTLQMKYDLGRGTYLGMNYTQLSLKARTPSPGQEIPYLFLQPERLGTLKANVRLNRYLNLNAELLYRGGWCRAEGDPRDDPGGYAIVNATLIAKNFLKELKGLEVRGSVLNLFNKEYTSPAGSGMLPDDIPMPGINFFLELRYTF